MIKKALEVYNKNLKEVAKALDIDLSSLYRKIKQYQLED
jgi:transcriptional regulator with PAS, ATPase and Fis domain